MNGYNLNTREFKKFQHLIHQKTGINLGDQKRDLVLSRLAKRLRILELKSFEEYYQYLTQERNSHEITAMINRITTNVTSFFRENHHFKVLSEIILPNLIKRKDVQGRRKIRIWSAGCSTGEEPYSIAITLADFFHNRHGWDIKILATDLDTEVLHKAERGIYPKGSVSSVPLEQLNKYFKKKIGQNHTACYQVSDRIKKFLVFRQLNLTMQHYPLKGPLDAIFCRNVIIYFDKDTKEKIIKKYYILLDDDGYLFMGHSESLIAMKERFHYIHNTVYQKAPV